MAVNYKALLNEIKQKYDTDQKSWEWFSDNSDRPELGIVKIDKRMRKLDIRGENTASTTVSKFLCYCDFGGEGKRHDVIHLIQQTTECSFIEAIKMLCSWEEKPLEGRSEVKRLESSEPVVEKKEPYTEKYVAYQKRVAKEDPVTFKKLLKGLCRPCSQSEIDRAVDIFDIGLNTYKPEDSNETMIRLFIPEYDDNMIPYGSFRYSRELDPKGLLRSNARRVLFGSHLLFQFNPKKPIIFAEGHSDTVVNNAKRIQTVTSGSSTTEIGPGLELLEGKEIHFYPDCDLAGIKGVCHKIIEIEKFNETADEKIKYKIFWWSLTAIRKDNSLLKEDDWISVQTKIFEQEKFKATPASMFENWKILQSQPVKEGFDWIDFHTLNKDHPKYKAFTNLYTY